MVDLTTSTVALPWDDLTPTHMTLPGNIANETYHGLFMSTSNGANSTINATFAGFNVVPEPSTLALLGVVAAGLLVRRWRRR